MLKPFTLITLIVCVLGPVAPASAQDDGTAEKTVEQAVWLLQKSTLVHRNGMHNILLRALRQMGDPRLEPLFGELVQRSHPGLKIHGILGMAEIDDPPKLDLALVADINSTAVQAQLVSAAIDSELLTDADARQLASWPTLDPAVRVLVTSQLVAAKQDVDPVLLDEAMKSDNAALRAMAALLKAQTGDAAAMQHLQATDAQAGVERDSVRALLLQTAMRYDFAVVGPWAMKMLNEDDMNRSIAYQALRAALMFDAPGAVNTWMHRFDTAGGEAERLRLAVLALDIADRLDPRIFQPMLSHEDNLLQQIGKVGTAIANGRPAAEAVAELVRMNNVLASRWAAQHALDLAAEAPERARPMLIAIIEVADDDKLIAAAPDTKPRFTAQRLEHAVAAVQKLHEHDPQGPTMLSSMIRKAPVLLQEAMLMGLIRSDGESPDAVVEGMSEFKSTAAGAMATLLRAKHAASLTDAQREELSLIVRGGAQLREPLRIQAAWTYLKLTQQDRVALAKVLGGGLPAKP